MVKQIYKLAAGFMLGIILVFAGGAAANAYTPEDAQSVAALSSSVYEQVSANKYEAAGGGTKSSLIAGSRLFTKDEESGVYKVNEKEFAKLSTNGKNKVADDVIKATNETVANEEGNETSLIDQSAKDNWFKDLSKSKGLGSRLINDTTSEWVPDFAAGKRILAPLTGIISTLMGLGAILIMSLLGLQVVAEVLFITIPSTRGFFGGVDTGVLNGGDKKVIYQGFVSGAARKAVEKADSNDGKALAIWAGNTFIKLLALAIVLVFFINGEILPFIGGLTDWVHALFV